MITLTRINGKDIVLNADLIEIVEKTPDTIISMTTGKKYIVKESVAEIVEKVLEYRRLIFPFKKIRNLPDEEIQKLLLDRQ